MGGIKYIHFYKTKGYIFISLRILCKNINFINTSIKKYAHTYHAYILFYEINESQSVNPFALQH